MNQSKARSAAFTLIPAVLGLIICGSVVWAQTTASAQTPQPRAHDPKLDSALLLAIRKGDTKKIDALATSGADVNQPGEAVDIVNLQAAGGWFTYNVKSAGLVGARLPMYEAILAKRPESVQALLAVGADVKTEFLEDAHSGIVKLYSPGDVPIFGSTRREFTFTDPQRGTITYDIYGNVKSTVRPTPAKKATYLSVVNEWLGNERNAKSRQKLQQIVDLLARAMQQ